MKITFKQQLWLSFGIVVGAMLAAGIALYFLSDALTVQADKIVTDNTLMASQAAAVGVLADLKRDAPQAATYTDALKKLLPTHDALIGFQEWINTEGQAHNLSLSFAFQGGNTPATPSTLGIDVFTLTANGGASDLVAFLNDVETKAPGFLLSIDSFDLVTDGPGYRLTAQGRLFSQ